MQLTGKVALITGAGSGIGKAAALLLAKEGAKVAALGPTEDELKQTVNQIQHDDSEAISLVTDISRQTRCNRQFNRLLTSGGALILYLPMQESTVCGHHWRNLPLKSGTKH